MFEIEKLDNCTLLQACEWIAFNWEPMPPKYEAYCNHIRPNSPLEAVSDIFGQSPKPSISWEEYINAINQAAAKLEIALLQKHLIAYGINEKTYSFHREQDINFEETDKLNLHENKIIGKIFTFSDIRINFLSLKFVFPADKEENPKTITFKLCYEDDDCIYLHTDNIQKTLIKKLNPASKTGQVIQFIMHHPHQTITRQDIKNNGVQNFDDADRLDVILKNVLGKLNIYKLFFPICSSGSVIYNPKTTDSTLKQSGIPVVVIH